MREIDFSERYYKWFDGKDVYHARVIGHTANYYKNGEVYALYQKWVPRSTDIEITEEEYYNYEN